MSLRRPSVYLGPPLCYGVVQPRWPGRGADRNVEPCESVPRRLAVVVFVAVQISTVDYISSGVGGRAPCLDIAPTATIPNAPGEVSTALTQRAQLGRSSGNVRL
jgi:hypothetical protein